MNKAIKTTLGVAAGAAAIAGVIAVPALTKAWGPTNRNLYTLAQVNSGETAGVITFNSITDAEQVGDERNFLSVQEAGADGKAVNPHGDWEGNNITVEDGKEYVLRMYVHNNASGGPADMATGTKVAISGIKRSSANDKGVQEVEVNGYVTADNATPNQVWDYVRFNSNSTFHLEYVDGSAVIYNRGAVGTTDPVTAADIANNVDGWKNHTITGMPLSDDIVYKAGSENGTLIGFDALDGNIPGCYGYSSYITIRVKAVSDVRYTVNKQVRKAGETAWGESVDAKIGDKLEFRIAYVNNDSVNQENVMIRDLLPSNLKYVEDTTQIQSVKYPQRATLNPDGELFTTGVNIGTFTPGSNAFIYFAAEVVDTDLKCGANTITNWGKVTVDDTAYIDPASATVNKVCDAPTPSELPTTGPMEVAGGVIAAGSVITAGGYFVASRRALRK